MAEEQQTQTQKPKKFIWVKIIAVIALLFGVSMISALVMLMAPLQEVTDLELKRVISKEIIQIIMGIILFVGGFGLLRMRKWGLYVFSIGALLMLIESVPEIGSLGVARSAFGAEFFISALIVTALSIIYGLASLIYLWRIRKHFN